MPLLATNSSSSLDFEALDDHLVKSSGQETYLIVEYLQDMVALRIVVVGRDITGVHLDGTSYPVAHTPIPLNRRVS
jgi:hypothetical protein